MSPVKSNGIVTRAGAAVYKGYVLNRDFNAPTGCNVRPLSYTNSAMGEVKLAAPGACDRIKLGQGARCHDCSRPDIMKITVKPGTAQHPETARGRGGGVLLIRPKQKEAAG